MKCQTKDCESEEFELATTAYLTFDAEGAPKGADATLTGLSDMDTCVNCKDCGEQQFGTEVDIAALVALIRVHKKLELSLPLLDKYTYEDGTAIVPDDITV